MASKLCETLLKEPRPEDLTGSDLTLIRLVDAACRANKGTTRDRQTALEEYLVVFEQVQRGHH